MSLFNSRTMTIKRSTGQYIDGRWSDNTPIEFEITGTIQPMRNGEEMQTLLEGRRADSVYKCYTKTLVYTTNQLQDRPRDIVVIDNEDYEIISVQNWGNGLINHYKFIAMRSKE